jgi:hypothetical protein
MVPDPLAAYPRARGGQTETTQSGVEQKDPQVKKHGAALLLVALTGTPAAAESWIVTGSNAQGEEAADMMKIKRSGNIVRYVSELRLRRQMALPGGAQYNKVMMLIEANCSTLVYNRLQVAAYLGANLVSPVDRTPEPAQRAAPNTTKAEQIRAVCRVSPA